MKCKMCGIDIIHDLPGDVAIALCPDCKYSGVYIRANLGRDLDMAIAGEGVARTQIYLQEESGVRVPASLAAVVFVMLMKGKKPWE